MSSIPSVGAPPAGMPKAIRVMAAAAGVIGANIHYSQPLLPVIAVSLAVEPSLAGLLPAITQLGFALSLLLLLPLADSIDRRRLILATVGVAAIALFAQSLAPTLPLVLVAAFVVGAASVAPQILSPFAATISPPGREGQGSGMVLSGILLGVLLSKVLAGVVGGAVGWRWLYGGAAVAMVVLVVVLWRTLPVLPSGLPQRFRELLASPVVLLRAHPSLRLHSALGALVSAAFMLFWSSYALQLFDEFGFGPLVAGLFGIAGIAGSLLAPLAGRLVDEGRAVLTLSLASALIVLAFALMWLGQSSVIMLIVAILLLDAGVGIAHSSNQARIFRVDPLKRGRLNSVYMFSYFTGGAVGSIAGVAAYGAVGWVGVCVAGLVAGCAIALLVTLNRGRMRF
ncbi:MFS transporter [Herbiconiux sp. VKM Ac-2851]|uniref:MFS transporter n=1 Tax=Herbiconiux sp. VKM Ac-2851 TaxID=2739025 RepID=UPI001567A886|nr:MFS transporter [Herbiconiux sp. VKM Ac-2851]NQX35111.1 MFS transporter [Herbiconiux sp. VKM Ac-2851]